MERSRVGFRWLLLTAVLALPAAPAKAQPITDAPVVFRDSLRETLSPQTVASLADGGLLLVQRSSRFAGTTLVVRYGDSGAIWRREFVGVESSSVHASGSSVVVTRSGADRTITRLDPDGRLVWAIAPGAPGAPPVSAGLFTAGPGAVVGYVAQSQYCEFDAPGPPRCVPLPDHASSVATDISLDAEGAWLAYRSAMDLQSRMQLLRVPRGATPPLLTTLERTSPGSGLAVSNERAAWLAVVGSDAPFPQELVRVSSVGNIARAPRPPAELRAEPYGESLVVAYQTEPGRVDRLDANLQVVESAPFAGAVLDLSSAASGRVCLIGQTTPLPGRIVVRCYGAGLQPEDERLLSPDADVGCPCTIGTGPDGALAHWSDFVAGTGGPTTQSVVSRVPRVGAAGTPEPVDRIDSPLSVGSRFALAREASGMIAVFGEGRVLEASSIVSRSAWAVRRSASGDATVTYRGPPANSDVLAFGAFDGTDLLAWARWTPAETFIGSPPLITRLHRIPAEVSGATRAALPAPRAGNQRFPSMVLRESAQWILAGTDQYESAGSFLIDAFVLAHDGQGAVAWERRYEGGQRDNPSVAVAASGLVVAHSWLGTSSPAIPPRCVVEGLSATGAVVWSRTESARFCATSVTRDASDTVLVASLDADRTTLFVAEISAATGNVVRSNAVAAGGWSSRVVAVRVADGWRVLGRVLGGGLDQLGLVAFNDELDETWRTVFDTPFGEGSPAMVALSGGRVDVAVVSGDNRRSVLSRWRVGPEGQVKLADRVESDTGGFDVPFVDARGFAVALAPLDGETSLMAATLFEPGGNRVVRLSARPDRLFEDSFD